MEVYQNNPFQISGLQSRPMPNNVTPVKQPGEDEDDFILEIKESVIKKCRTKVDALSKIYYKVKDFLLAVAMFSLGIPVSASLYSVKLDSRLGMATFIICPVVFAGSLVAYFFILKDKKKNEKDLANEMRDMYNQAKEASCDLWIDGLTKEGKDQILAKLNIYRLDKMSEQQKEIHIKQYHSEKIWPDEYTKMRGS